MPIPAYHLRKYFTLWGKGILDKVVSSVVVAFKSVASKEPLGLTRL